MDDVTSPVQHHGARTEPKVEARLVSQTSRVNIESQREVCASNSACSNSATQDKCSLPPQTQQPDSQILGSKGRWWAPRRTRRRTSQLGVRAARESKESVQSTKLKHGPPASRLQRTQTKSKTETGMMKIDQPLLHEL